MNVKIIKLIDGSELVATEGEAGVYTKVRSVRIMQGGAVGLVPFLVASSDAEVRLNASSIVTIIDCPSDFEKAYLESTSGLVLG